MDKQSLLLVVDEDPNFQEIFSKRLTAEGFEVAHASNGAEAIEKAKAIKPSLVLMDVKMPGMDGVETFMKMREDPETKDIRVVFLTSFGNPEEGIQNLNSRFSEEIGALGYIQKTEDLDNIVSKVKSFTQPA